MVLLNGNIILIIFLVDMCFILIMLFVLKDGYYFVVGTVFSEGKVVVVVFDLFLLCLCYCWEFELNFDIS